MLFGKKNQQPGKSIDQLNDELEQAYYEGELSDDEYEKYVNELYDDYDEK